MVTTFYILDYHCTVVQLALNSDCSLLSDGWLSRQTWHYVTSATNLDMVLPGGINFLITIFMVVKVRIQTTSATKFTDTSTTLIIKAYYCDLVTLLCSFDQSVLPKWYNKQLSYRRDSAHPRSWCPSRSFKVIDFDTNRNPYHAICDFLLVNNTNLNYVSHRLQDIAQYWSDYRFWYAVPFINELVLRNLCEYCHKWYIAITRFFGLHFCRRHCRSIFNHFDVIRLQSYRIWWNNAK